MREAHVINPQLEMLAVLHNCEGVPVEVKDVVECCIELLPVYDQAAVPVYSSPSTDFG